MLTLEKKPGLYGRALEEMDRSFGGDGAPHPFASLRQQARDAFTLLGIPTRKDEAWKYTDVRPALEHDYAFVSCDFASRLSTSDLEPFRIPGVDAYTAVVVNGVFVPALSDLENLEGAQVASLRAAAAAHGSAIADYFGRYTAIEKDAFAALNTAFDLDGLFIDVQKGASLDKPIHVMHLTDPQDLDSGEGAFVQSRHLFVFGEGSEGQVIETHHILGDNPVRTFGNHVTEVVVAAEAKAEHLRVQDEGDEAGQVNTMQVYQEDNSSFSTATFTFRSGLVRNNLNIVADGKDCETHLNGLYIARGNQHVDNHTLMDHAQPGCESNELYKGILYDESTGVFNGKVFVRREAQQTNAYQQSQGVVLSDDARHFSKPELEIYADDVKCSHGSTTGEIDAEALFYCRARGIALDEARALLLYAFAHDVVERVEPAPLRDWLDGRIVERLS